ncbi:MAG: hypothetical protein JWM57_3769 [Phycisphaerales bacterium]|nr:hypothetical protein [Phycisphaerales bacterium]
MKAEDVPELLSGLRGILVAIEERAGLLTPGLFAVRRESTTAIGETMKRRRIPRTAPIPTGLNVTKSQTHWNAVLKSHGLGVSLPPIPRKIIRRKKPHSFDCTRAR